MRILLALAFTLLACTADQEKPAPLECPPPGGCELCLCPDGSDGQVTCFPGEAPFCYCDDLTC